ncbi:unnamed protein product [Euphydryas editha]|uniref:Uncharacterized protein n=1 Tax=Euphydryas editha TaxID=104508 RepID=A0AAU9TPU2_EUPED|nr:unnamed protein product [Euphydryas editha]
MNSEEDIGYRITHEDEVLKWTSSTQEEILITCDRDIGLETSKDHCHTTEISVWDMQNEKSDLLLTFVGQSNNSEESTEEEDIAFDDSESCDSEDKENDCAKCRRNYYDMKRPKVDWIQCGRCHNWN